jgi:hypothetical protein
MNKSHRQFWSATYPTPVHRRDNVNGLQWCSINGLAVSVIRCLCLSPIILVQGRKGYPAVNGGRSRKGPRLPCRLGFECLGQLQTFST